MFLSYFQFCTLQTTTKKSSFLRRVCKRLPRSTNLFSRNHPKLYSWLIRKGRQMPNTEQLLYQTHESSHWRCSVKKAVLKNFAITTGKYLHWCLFISFIKKTLQHRCFTVTKFLRTPWWTSAYGSFWIDFRKWLLGTFFLDSRIQIQPD